jgi:Holliday junction resolvase RusA-like endonuclease
VSPRSVEWETVGVPAPQGSLRAMLSPQGNAVAIPSTASGYLRYRADLRTDALTAMRDGDQALMRWAVSMRVTFVLPRPNSHFWPINKRHPGPERELRHGVPVFPIGMPDLDKLLRSVFDALTGVVYVDDAQVIGLEVRKHYANEHGSPGLTHIFVAGGEGNG